MRRRYTAAVVRFGWPIMLTDAQVTRLRTFYKDEAKGVMRFNITHPQLGTSVEARFTRPPSIVNVAPNAYRCSLELEVLP